MAEEQRATGRLAVECEVTAARAKYRAVLFDLDGTLLDTLEDLADSLNAVLARNKFPTHPLGAYKYFVGDGIVSLVQRAMPEGADRATLDRLVAEQRVEYGRRWADKTHPYDGIAELLDELNARGLKLTVFSNKPDAATRQVVAHFLPKWKFDVVRGEIAGTPRKPDPAGAFAVARELNVPPEQFLYLGDTNTDMQTANSAGMFAVGATWGFRDAAELAAAGAKALVTRPSALLKLL